MAKSSNFESLYNNAPCGLITFQIDGSIVYINQKLLSWLGLTQDDIINKPFADLLDHGGKLYYQLFIQPSLKLHNEVKEISFNIPSPKGSFQGLFSASVSEVDKGGEAVVNATIFKITDRQKYEDELLKKRLKAEEENRLKTDVLNNIAFDQAHLVRAPLANILGIISLLDQMNLEDDVKYLIAMLQDSATKLDLVVTEIVNKTNS